MSWIELPRHEVTRDIAMQFLARGLVPGETVLHVTMGQEWISAEGVKRAGKAAVRKLSAIQPKDAILAAVAFGAIAAGDAAIHALGVDPMASLADIGGADGPERPYMGRAGFLLALTTERLVLLDVSRALVPRVPARSYAAVRGAYVWPRPPSVRMTLQRKLCFDTVVLTFAEEEGERTIRFFRAAGFPDNVEDARRIARALASP